MNLSQLEPVEDEPMNEICRRESSLNANHVVGDLWQTRAGQHLPLMLLLMLMELKKSSKKETNNTTLQSNHLNGAVNFNQTKTESRARARSGCRVTRSKRAALAGCVRAHVGSELRIIKWPSLKLSRRSTRSCFLLLLLPTRTRLLVELETCPNRA